jgi:glyoxylase-like metal-dependent hydrolase (beta-lactamase superfamily II)
MPVSHLIVPTLAAGLAFLDLQFLGRPHAIATGIVQAPGSIALIDPGPSSCLTVLERELSHSGIALSDVTDLLLTHIHLDHAGVTGTLVQRNALLRVYVHERGAPHLIDPSKLLDSATRLYGEDMDRLWGEVLPVPAANVIQLSGGERVSVGGREFSVAYTPGHASHHVSYFDASSGVAFVGDTAGVSVDGGYVLPPTPPPDINLELWEGSLQVIERWAPATLFLTHFGPISNVGPHLGALRRNLTTVAAMVRDSIAEDGSDAERRERFVERLRLELRRQMTDAQASAYEAATPLDLLWLGLARYWRKKVS